MPLLFQSAEGADALKLRKNKGSVSLICISQQKTLFHNLEVFAICYMILSSSWDTTNACKVLSVVDTTVEKSSLFVLSGSSNRRFSAVNLFHKYPHKTNNHHICRMVRRKHVLFTVEPDERDLLVPRDSVALSRNWIGPPIEHSVALTLCEHALCKYVEILSTGHRVPDAYTCGRFHVRRISNLPATKSLLLYIILSSYTITPAHYAEPHRNS